MEKKRAEGLISPCLVMCCLVLSYFFLFCVLFSLVWPCLIYLIWLGLSLPCLVLSYLVLTSLGLFLSCLGLAWLVSSCLGLTRLGITTLRICLYLFSFVLPYLVLSRFILSCLVLSFSFFVLGSRWKPKQEMSRMHPRNP
jgi:hypothetical protein